MEEENKAQTEQATEAIEADCSTETKTHDDVINEEIEQEHAEVAKENAEAAECSPCECPAEPVKDEAKTETTV